MSELLKRLSKYKEVIALKGTDYEGLKGDIENILVGAARQTENDCEADIIVTFQEPDYQSIETSHPHLNGTSISEVLMREDELGFFINDEIATNIHGKIVCLDCFTPLDLVNETQFEDITWSFNSEKGYYEKSDVGGSEGKKCPLCNGEIHDCGETVLSY